jgi:dihydroceramide fatty acyl 2-hydroxylase
MPRNFGLRRRHPLLSRAFDLKPWSYFLDLVLAPIAASVLLWLAARGDLGGFALAAAVLAGVLFWTLAEYWIHRLVFHGAMVFEPMHQMHHALPKDMIGIASWGTFLAFAGIWLIAETFAGGALGSAFTAGALLGYLFYCAIHVRFHHHGPGAKLSRYVAFMNAHHASHHRGGKGNFGVSSPLWDFVFGTYHPSR